MAETIYLEVVHHATEFVSVDIDPKPAAYGLCVYAGVWQSSD